MSSKIVRLCLLFAAVVLLVALAAGPALAAGGVTLEVTLGKLIAGDRSLSDPDGQSCADCHLPAAGYADPDQDLPVSQGVDPADFGGRNAPTWAYTAWSPNFFFDGDAWVGGMFWDGRAKGSDDFSPLEMQAMGPFLNEVEMQNESKDEVIREVSAAPYATLFRLVYGPDSLDDVDAAYNNVARAIAAYESSQLVNTFSSRYDAFMAGNRKALNAQEKRGLVLFNDPEKGNCSACHPSAPDPAISKGLAEGKALFTDYTYDNLGIPQNPDVVDLTGNAGLDLGLGKVLNNRAADGLFKVSTLRNIALTAPYGHNGYFATLEEIVHFYNTAADGTWPLPEVEDNVNRDELGELFLTPADEDDIVAFLKTLTDRVIVRIPIN